MVDEKMAALVQRIESGSARDPELVAAVMRGLREAVADSGDSPDAGALVSTEQALALVARALPGWHVALEGAPWTCTLRESGARDDDELIGIGRATTPALAVVAAFLLVMARRAARKGVSS